MISRTMFIEAFMDCDMDYVVLIYGVACCGGYVGGGCEGHT